MNRYELKLAARRARLQERASSTRAEANTTYTRAKGMASQIPFGQPILVGHHSERRDRNFRGRIESTFRKSFELDAHADDLARRAESVGTAGVSSDDPDAIAKLREQLATAEANQEKMKKANRFVRANKRDALAEMGYTADEIEKLFTPDFAKRTGYPNYALTNNNANIRRIRERIATLEKIGAREAVQQQGNGYEYREEKDDNRIWFVFPAKPAAEVRDFMKRHAFKFSPSRCESGNSVYVRQMTPAALNVARWMRPELDKLCGQASGAAD
jgi:hypothetical protein